MSTSDTWTRRIPGLLAVGGLVFLLAVPAAAQDTGAASGWTAWLGCWEAAEEEASSLCVRPTGAADEVELLTVEDGEVVDRKTVRADGERREAAREGCAGWERAEFSRDGRRLHLRSELECEGGVRREASGMIAFVSPTEWIDVRSVGVEGRRSAWVRRYRARDLEPPEEVDLRALDDRRLSVETARMAAGAPPDLDAVVEASERVHPEAVSAWIVELDRRFPLDGERLVRLADAGVPDEVIDVVVAVSHPERFSVGGVGEVARRGRTGRTGADARRPYGWDSWYGNPFRYRPYRYHHRYRVGWSYGFAPWSYSRFGWGYGGAGFGYRPVVVRVEVRDREVSEGRVVKGRGYTRTNRSESSSASPSSSSSDRTGISRSGRSSRTSISPSGGYSSGSSSSGSGRKAKPRGGSGGSGSSGSSGGSGGGR